jgi:hypothetical protein
MNRLWIATDLPPLIVAVDGTEGDQGNKSGFA